jgi:hypothetical protein
MEEEPISDVLLRTQHSATAQKQTNDSLWDLVNDGEFLFRCVNSAYAGRI